MRLLSFTQFGMAIRGGLLVARAWWGIHRNLEDGRPNYVSRNKRVKKMFSPTISENLFPWLFAARRVDGFAAYQHKIAVPTFIYTNRRASRSFHLDRCVSRRLIGKPGGTVVSPTPYWLSIFCLTSPPSCGALFCFVLLFVVSLPLIISCFVPLDNCPFVVMMIVVRYAVVFFLFLFSCSFEQHNNGNCFQTATNGFHF